MAREEAAESSEREITIASWLKLGPVRIKIYTTERVSAREALQYMTRGCMNDIHEMSIRLELRRQERWSVKKNVQLVITLLTNEPDSEDISNPAFAGSNPVMRANLYFPVSNLPVKPTR